MKFIRTLNLPTFFIFGTLLAIATMTILFGHGAFSLALAQTPDVPAPVVPEGISIPIATWLTAIGEWVVPLISAVVLFLIRKLPSQIASILMTLRVDQMLEKAIAYAINTVAGASKDKALNVSTGNQVVDKSLQFIVTNAPGWMIKWMGDGDAIRQKIIARLNVAPEAALPAPSIPVSTVTETLK